MNDSIHPVHPNSKSQELREGCWRRRCRRPTGGSGRDGKELELEDHPDKLSQLPDDVLSLILENLTTIEAARTSVLSRRWMHLFKQRSRIFMSIREFYPKRDQDSEFTCEDMVKSNTIRLSMLQYQRFIRNLTIKFHIIEQSINIVSCVDKAMTDRQIASLEFVLYPEQEKTRNWTQDLTTSYGRLFMRFLSAGPCAFGSLSRLHIWCVKLSIDDMTNLLNACNNLEHLYLHCCIYGYESVVEIEHPRLVTLIINCCKYQIVELRWLPRLTRVTCHFWVQMIAQYPISFGYVPQLSTLIIRNKATIRHKTIQLSEFLSNYVMIRELNLKFECLKVWIQPEAPNFIGPVLQNLEVLYLGGIREECNLDWTMFFLEAAPLLKKIHVQVSDHPGWGKRKGASQDEIGKLELLLQENSNHLSWKAPDDLKHYSLKELIISGFQVKIKFTMYIRRVDVS